MTTDWFDPSGFPTYASPPVVEVAMAIEFGEIPGLDTYRLARLQDLWSADFDAVTTHPGALPTDFNQQAVPSLMLGGVPPVRFWAENRTSGRLIQTQSDRLILNWRRSVSEGKYPGYLASLRGEYVDIWGRAGTWLGANDLVRPAPVVAEFVYVNAVRLGGGEGPKDVLTILLDPPNELPGAAGVTRFEINREVTPFDQPGLPLRIAVSGQTQVGPDGERDLVFTVVARALIGASLDDPMAALDAAHAVASHTFDRLICDDKKREWGAGGDV